MKGLFNKRTSLILLIAVCLSLAFASTAFAGFSTEQIQIIDPPGSGVDVQGVLSISGTAKIDEVWFAIRGPQNELEAKSAKVIDGKFSTNLNLRFGPGIYTIWGDDNKTSFDGRIKFTVRNVIDDNRYISASNYVDSDNPEIIKLSASLVKDKKTDMEKAQAIHDWVAGNIKYDYQAYADGKMGLKSASQTLKDGSGVCSGYSFLYAALSRAAGLETKVVYGQIKGGDGWAAQRHAWNEVLVDGQWISVDSTWDAGYIRSGSFVPSLSQKYFNADSRYFDSTHSNKEDKLF